ncbi:hypothetical protein A9168_07470 [Macellibacteroides sp. HH-ZS]|nr:hypothetical protein A9168_07470 [Macellibacteroides sp. HH-ZS]
MKTKSLTQDAGDYENGIELGKAFFGHVGKTFFKNPRRNLDNETLTELAAFTLFQNLDELTDFAVVYMDSIVPLTSRIRESFKGDPKEEEINSLMDKNIQLILNVVARLDSMCEFTKYIDDLIE